jgi:hypothetical protein
MTGSQLRPYFLCTACLLTPSATAINCQDAFELRARRTAIVSIRSTSARSLAIARSAVNGSSDPASPVSVASGPVLMASTVVDDREFVNLS